jgi:large subunit ribosomal protein L28
MSRRCVVTGKGVQVGHKVSHANNKTKRRFLPNLQETSLFSESLGRDVRLRLSTNGIRTIEHKGGLDAWLVEVPAVDLPADLKQVKRLVEKAVAARAAA